MTADGDAPAHGALVDAVRYEQGRLRRNLTLGGILFAAATALASILLLLRSLPDPGLPSGGLRPVHLALPLYLVIPFLVLVYLAIAHTAHRRLRERERAPWPGSTSALADQARQVFAAQRRLYLVSGAVFAVCYVLLSWAACGWVWPWAFLVSAAALAAATAAYLATAYRSLSRGFPC